MANRRTIYGRGPVAELLRSDTEIELVAATPEAAKVLELATHRELHVETRSVAELDAWLEPGANHQGVVAVVGEYRYVGIESFFEVAARRRESPCIVVLDEVQDPHNLGAIMRSSYLLGVHGIVIPERRAVGVTATVTKVSAGASEHMGVARVPNLARAIDLLKDFEVWIAGVHMTTGSQTITTWDGCGATALVFGSEGRGIRPQVAKQCDFHISIPMAGERVGSLNVSVAAGIALYEVARQRQESAGEAGRD